MLPFLDNLPLFTYPFLLCVPLVSLLVLSKYSRESKSLSMDGVCETFRLTLNRCSAHTHPEWDFILMLKLHPHRQAVNVRVCWLVLLRMTVCVLQCICLCVFSCTHIGLCAYMCIRLRIRADFCHHWSAFCSVYVSTFKIDCFNMHVCLFQFERFLNICASLCVYNRCVLLCVTLCLAACVAVVYACVRYEQSAPFPAAEPTNHIPPSSLFIMYS